MNVLIMFVMVGLVAGADSTVELPKQVQSATGNYRDALLSAKSLFDRSSANAHAGYLEALQRAMVTETKAGRLESAIAIRDLCDAAKSSGPIKADVGIAKNGFDPKRLGRGFARIQSASLVPSVLRESDAKDGWRQVPDAVKRCRSVLYVGGDRSGGVADFTVTKSGVIMVVCDFSYQGNASGDWTESRWTKEQFVANGWAEVTSEKLGGLLVSGNGVEHTVFSKQVNRGEHYRLRCNKYRPPFVLILY